MMNYEIKIGQEKQEAQVIKLSRFTKEDTKELVNLAKFWDNLTARPALFNGLLLYSSEQGGGYAAIIVGWALPDFSFPA